MTTYIGAATGTLQFGGDSNWYGIKLQAGTEYLFNLGNGTLSDPAIGVYNSAGTLVYSGSTSGAGGVNTQIAFDPTTSGTYYIAALSASGQQTGSYALTASSATFDYAGNTATTGTVAIGGSVTGNISNAGQNDWFQVQMTAGKEYTFTVTGGTLTAAQQQLVSLYDSTGKLLQSGTDFDTLGGGQITFTATTTGNYFVGVSDQGGNTGTFTLAAANVTTDYGSTPATAGSVSVGGSISGNLTNVQQRDWFAVTLTAGTQYVFTVGGGTLGANATVAVYDSSGNVLVPQISGGAANGAERAFTPTTSGTYYVEAGAMFGNTGTFSLTVGTAAYDFAGTVNTLGALSIGGTISGNIGTPGQNDWFKVSLQPGTDYVFHLAGTTLTSPQISLYNSAGQLVEQYAANGSNPAQLVFSPTTAGTYFVGASGPAGNTGTFTLTENTINPDFLGNTNTQGGLIVGGSTNGQLTAGGQNDWFKVSLTAGKEYDFSIGGALSNAQVTLYDSNGNQIETGGTSIGYLAATSGTYYVGASSSSEATGSYTVSAATYTGSSLPSTGTTGVFTSAVSEISNYQQGLLTSANSISDSMANIQANLDGLETVAAAGLLKAINLTDSVSAPPTLSVTAAQFDNDYKAIIEIQGNYTLNIQGFSAGAEQFILNAQNQGVHYLPGTSNPNSNQVIEISSTAAGASPIVMGNGYNAVIIDGTHSQTAAGSGDPDSYSVAVDANGVVTLHDNNTGQNQTITHANYLIFNDAASNSDGSFQSILFVEGSTNSQITSLYQAAFLRQPDLGGVEYYATFLAQGTETLHQIAVNFLASQEFNNDYPAAALAPDNGGPHDTAYIDLLYQNVLHRTPIASEVAYYTNALAEGVWDRAQLLINFSASPENQANITSFLVNTNNGAYGEPNDLVPASTVLSEMTSTGVFNSAAIDPSTISGSLTANGITVTPPAGGNSGSITLGVSAPAGTYELSTSFANITVGNNGATIIDTTVNATITVNGSNNSLETYLGGSDTVNLMGGVNTTVSLFTPGSGTSLNVANSTNTDTVQILTPTNGPITNLNFTNGTNYVINVGNVGTGTAAAVASAANAAYTVADTAGEHVTFIGQTSAGNTVVYFFGSTAGVSNGIIPASSLAGTADTNVNHLVDASELTMIATIVGVLPTALSNQDL